MTIASRWMRMWTRQARYVDLRRLQPGDVILTRPARDLESLAIAAFGRSWYSHAQISVGDPKEPSRAHTYEATTASVPVGKTKDEVVGLVQEKWLRDGYWILPGERIPLWDVSGYARLKVMRWMGEGTPGLGEFRRRVPHLCRRLRLRPYATINALTDTLPWPLRIVAAVVGRLMAFAPSSRRSGLFCSQLVALIYETGTFPLFVDIPPDKATPRRLSGCKRLCSVTEEVLFRNPGDGAFERDAHPAGEDAHLALMRKQLGVIRELVSAIRAASSSDPDERAAMPWINQMTAFISDNDLPLAIEAARRAARALPNLAIVWVVISQLEEGIADDVVTAGRVAASRAEAISPGILKQPDGKTATDA